MHGCLTETSVLVTCCYSFSTVAWDVVGLIFFFFFLTPKKSFRSVFCQTPMCFRYRPGEAGGTGGREAPGSEGQEEREEGETLYWHHSAVWRGKKETQVENFC